MIFRFFSFFVRYASQEGAFISSSLFEATDPCFWDLTDSLCTPDRKQFLTIYNEDIYLSYEQEAKSNGGRLTSKIQKMFDTYGVLAETGLTNQINTGKFKFTNKSFTEKQLVALEDFKVRSISFHVVLEHLKNSLPSPELQNCDFLAIFSR